MMKALVVVVVAVLIGVLTAGAVRLLFPGEGAVAGVEAPVVRALSGARPLTWLDDTTLLVARDGRIVRYDVARGMEAGEVAAAYAPSRYEVMTPAGGVFALNEPRVGRDGVVRYSEVVFQRVEDWARPDIVRWLTGLDEQRTNRLDGAHYEHRSTTAVETLAGRRYHAAWTGELVRTADGRTRIYEDRDGEVLVFLEQAGRETATVLPGSAGRRRQAIASSYDWGGGRYLWYEVAPNFDADRPSWPLRAWWVSRDGQVEGELELPAGPWVRKYTLWYTLKHMSAGPATYSHMRVIAASGRVFIHVFGRAVADRVASVYELDHAAGEWRRRVAGELDGPVAVSPDGCRLAYARGGEMEVLEVCGSG
jgi:hypothetical protein